MYKAGLVSYYGGSLMNNWGEYGEINEYTKTALDNAFFNPRESFEIKSSTYCSYFEDLILFNADRINDRRKTQPEPFGYEVLQGRGKTAGTLLGGCAEVFVELCGTPIWPQGDAWDGKILFMEVSDEEKNSDIPEEYFRWILRNLAAQGIFGRINGIIMGKPPVKEKHDIYKNVLYDVVHNEEGQTSLPIIYNLNFGHAYPIGIIPYGLRCELDCDRKTVTVLEPFTK